MAISSLIISMPQMEAHAGELRLADERLRKSTLELLKHAYHKALPSFEREKLSTYPKGTQVFLGHIGDQLVTTTAIKNATNRAELEEFLETDISELVELIEQRGIGKNLPHTKGDSGASDITMSNLQTVLDYPIAVASRAGNLPGYWGVNTALRYRILEYVWFKGFQAQAGLSADVNLQKRLALLGYDSIPVQNARFIFPGIQRVSWLPRNRFREVANQLHARHLLNRFSTCWGHNTRMELATSEWTEC